MSPGELLHTYQEACDVCEGSSCGHEDGHRPVAPVAHAVVEVPGGKRGAVVRPPLGHCLANGARIILVLTQLLMRSHKQAFPIPYWQSVLPLGSVMPTSGGHSGHEAEEPSHCSESHYTSFPPAAAPIDVCGQQIWGKHSTPTTLRSMVNTALRDKHTLGSNLHTASCWLIGPCGGDRHHGF